MAQLSEAIIRKAVREAVRNFLNEGLTDKEYHFCSLNFVHSICQTNEIHLTMATNLGDATDKYNRFYLSLSRTRNVYESYGVNRTCRIEFDGTALKRYGFAGRPLNYNAVKGDDNKWYGTKGDRSRQFEYEDRLLFTDPVIENANKYIVRIDVLTEGGSIDERYLEDILNNKYGIPVYVYGNKKDYNFQTNNTINDRVSSIRVDDFKFDNSYSINMMLGYLVRLYCGRNLDKYDVEDVLDDFGIQHDTEVVNTVFRNARNSGNLENVCEMLAHSQYSPRFIGKEDYANGPKIQRLANSVLRKYNARSFNELALKINK